MPVSPRSAGRLDAIRRRLSGSFKTVGTITLLAGLLSVAGAAIAAAPAAAAQALTCTAPSGASTTTTTTTFVDGQASSYNVECEEETGASGTFAYPASISITTGTLPTGATYAGANQTTCCTSAGGTTTTSGTGTTEEYVLICNIAYTPPGGYNTAGAAPNSPRCRGRSPVRLWATPSLRR